VKGNRQIVVAWSGAEQVFKIPDGLDLEDETVVKDWCVKWGTLYISYVNGEEEKIEFDWQDEHGCKYPDVEIKDADEMNVEYEEDNEQKCRDYDYTWTTEDFDTGKGRVAFSYPSEGIKEGDVVCTLCHVKDFDEKDNDESREVDSDGFDIIWCVTCGEVRTYDKDDCEKCEKGDVVCTLCNVKDFDEIECPFCE